MVFLDDGVSGTRIVEDRQSCNRSWQLSNRIATLGHCRRDTAIWGPDAKEYKPERWLEGDKASPTKFPAFHAGPRTCKFVNDILLTFWP